MTYPFWQGYNFKPLIFHMSPPHKIIVMNKPILGNSRAIRLAAYAQPAQYSETYGAGVTQDAKPRSVHL